MVSPSARVRSCSLSRSRSLRHAPLPSPASLPALTGVAQGARGLCLALWLGTAASAWAQAAPAGAAATARVAQAIPAGPLGQALSRLAAGAGVTLTFDPALTQGRVTAGLPAGHTLSEGLALLLRDTGLVAVERQGGGYTVQPAAARPVADGEAAPGDYSLREVRVSARRLGETEGTGSYTSDAITIGKTAQAMRELPQSVSVLTKQRLEDQNLTDLGRAADQIVGLTVKDNNYRLPGIYSRGFEITSYQLDGGAPMSTQNYANVAFDLSQYDRVEVLRGAAGLLNGTGNPGGAINLVRKMPTATPQFSFMASAGRWNSYRTEFDASGPLAFDGKLRGRAVLSYDNRDYFVDRRATEKPTFYGVLEADLGPAAVLALGLRKQNVHERGTSNDVPRYTHGGDLGLPRATGLGPGWDYLKGTSDEVFAKLTWRLAERWTLRMNAARTRNDGHSLAVFSMGAVDPQTGRTSWGGSLSDYRNRQTLLDANLSGAFDLLGRTHEVLAGFDAQDIASRWRSFGQVGCQGMPLDVFNPGATPCTYMGLPDKLNRIYSPNATRQYGAYGTLRLEVAEGTKLIVGARANRFRYHQVATELQDDGNWAVQSATRYNEPTKIVPFGGLVHDLDAHWSAYASYAQIFNPQASLKAGPAPGTGLEPMRGSNAEVGVKGELLDGRLNAAFALYRVVQDKRALQDSRYPDDSYLYGGSCCYVATGKVVSQGLDVEVNGEVARGVNVYAGYTYNSNRDQSTDTAFSTITPRHSLKFWGTWQLPGAASAWKLGGGASIKSRQYVSGEAATWNPASGRFDGAEIPFRYTQGGHAVWNLMAEYRLDPRWTLALNLNNLFDKSYYRTVGSSWGGNYYGEPRSLVATLRGRF